MKGRIQYTEFGPRKGMHYTPGDIVGDNHARVFLIPAKKQEDKIGLIEHYYDVKAIGGYQAKCDNSGYYDFGNIINPGYYLCYVETLQYAAKNGGFASLRRELSKYLDVVSYYNLTFGFDSGGVEWHYVTITADQTITYNYTFDLNNP